jgi:hypothetical protein
MTPGDQVAARSRHYAILHDGASCSLFERAMSRLPITIATRDCDRVRAPVSIPVFLSRMFRYSTVVSAQSA